MTRFGDGAANNQYVHDSAYLYGMYAVMLKRWRGAILQALVSFVGDCPDSDLLQDVLELTCSLLDPRQGTHRPLLACLAELGGVQLFMSLVQREQQPIRVLGLRILAAFVPFPSPPSPQLSPRPTGKPAVVVCAGACLSLPAAD